MRICRLLVLLLLLFSAAPASAWDLAVATGFNYNHPSFNPDPPNGGTVTTKAAFDFGALLDIPLGSDYVLGTGLIRHTRDMILDDDTAATETSYSGWLIPMTFRFMRAKFLGIGFGPYVALLSQRTKTSIHYHKSPGNATINADDPNRKNYDIGLQANLRIAIPVYHQAKVIVDGSYLFGFTDLNKSAVEEDKTQELLLMVGLQIPMGGESTESAASTPAPPTSSVAPEPTPSPTLTPPENVPVKPAVKKKKKKEKHHE
jgi:hypothetical protein